MMRAPFPDSKHSGSESVSRSSTVTPSPGTSPEDEYLITKVADQSPLSFTRKIIDERKGKIGFTKSGNRIAQDYDAYYRRETETDPHSALYNKRWGNDRILANERDLIKDSVYRLIDRLPGERTLRLMDFGAGDGRLFPVFYELAEELKDRGIKLELLAVDPSSEGLRSFQTDLSAQYGFGFKEEAPPLHPIDANDTKANGYVAGTMERGNLSVTFIHSHVDDSMEHTAQLIGDGLHLSVAMFGVLAHVPTRAKRREYVQMFYDQTLPGGATLITVPTPKRFEREQVAFDVLREQQRDVGLATERRDIYYCKFAEDSTEPTTEKKRKASLKKKSEHASARKTIAVDNYYHTFTAKELYKLLTLLANSEHAKEDGTGPGFALDESTIHAVSIGHAADLTKSEETNLEDAIESKSLTRESGVKRSPADFLSPSSTRTIHNFCDYIAARGVKPISR